MLKARDSLTDTLRRTLLIQATLTGIAAIVALLAKDAGFMLAVLYGGAVTSIGTGLHGWRLLKIDTAGDNNPATPAVPTNAGAEVFKGSLLKLVAMVVLLGLGMGYLQLDPLAVLTGFIVAYGGFMFAGGYAPRSKPPKI